MRFLAKQFLHQRLNARHARLSSDQDHFIDLAGIDARVLHALLARTNGALNDVFDHRLQLRARQFLDQMLWPGSVGGDEGQVDLMLHRGRQFNLGALCRIAQPLEGHFVSLTAQVQAFVLLEFLNEPIDDALVKVVAT